MGVDDAKTPSELFEQIRDLLSTKVDAEDPARFTAAYQSARTKIVTFRDTLDTLPRLPPHKSDSDAVVGLQECMEWCVDSKTVVDSLLGRIDTSALDEAIRGFQNLRGIPGSMFPKVDDSCWKKAHERVVKILSRFEKNPRHAGRVGRFRQHNTRTKLYYHADIICRLASTASRTTGNSLLGTSSTSSEELHTAYREKDVVLIAELFYQLLDSKYTTALGNMGDAIRRCIEEEINDPLKAAGGADFDIYDKLKGLGFEECCQEIGSVYSLDNIVEAAFLGTHESSFGLFPKPMEPLVDRAIEILEKVKEEAAEYQSRRAKPTDTSKKPTPPKKSSSRTKTTEPPIASEEWKPPRRTVFVVDDNRIKLYHSGQPKDLRLGSKGKAHKLLFLFSANQQLGQDYIKSEFCTDKTNPFDEIRNINRALSKKVAGMGFKDIPVEVDWIRFDKPTNRYYCRLQVISSEDLKDLTE